MVDGKYSIDDANKEKLELWIKKGGILIAVKNANKFLIEKEIIKLEIEEYPKNTRPNFVWTRFGQKVYTKNE